jgi:hypothetical protein
MSSEAVYIPSKRKYVFCADQEGLKFLLNIMEQVKGNALPHDIFLFDGRDLSHLAEFLSKQKMGTYLYMALPHAELQKMKKIVEDIGFLDEEMQLIGFGKKRIRIFCCRCQGINEMTEERAEITCNKCRIELSLSDHYSVFHDAYLGYVAKL